MLGQQIKKARLRVGLSQTELAEKIHAHQVSISRLEKGEFDEQHVRLGTLRKLCKALHVTPNDLMGYERE